MNDDVANALAWSVLVGACYGTVAFAFVLALDWLNPTFAPELDFVLSATAGVVLAASALWYGGAERAGVVTRKRSASVGAVVGLVAPSLAFALNPSVYGSSPNVVVNALGGVVAAFILGARGLLGTFGTPIVLGALVGWSLAGWLAFLRDRPTRQRRSR